MWHLLLCKTSTFANRSECAVPTTVPHTVHTYCAAVVIGALPPKYDARTLKHCHLYSEQAAERPIHSGQMDSRFVRATTQSASWKSTIPDLTLANNQRFMKPQGLTYFSRLCVAIVRTAQETAGIVAHVVWL